MYEPTVSIYGGIRIHSKNDRETVKNVLTPQMDLPALLIPSTTDAQYKQIELEQKELIAFFKELRGW